MIPQNKLSQRSLTNAALSLARAALNYQYCNKILPITFIRCKELCCIYSHVANRYSGAAAALANNFTVHRPVSVGDEQTGTGERRVET